MISVNISSVMFDFDYTLADSSAGVIECVVYAFNRMNLPVPPAGNICRTIGLSLAETFKTLSGKYDSISIEEFIRLFSVRSDQVMLDRCKIFDTVKPAIKHLRKNGLNLGIVSTKYHYRIAAFLRRENLENDFEVIVGGEDVSRHKPAPDGLLMAIQQLKCSPSKTLYIGDSTIDAEAARQASVPFVAVLTGVASAPDFDRYAPLAVIADLAKLPEFLSGNNNTANPFYAADSD
jgi:phosphoglycolate phosphatase